MNSCTLCTGQMPYHPGSNAVQCESCDTFTPWSKQANPFVFDARTLSNRNAKIATGASSTLGDTAASINHRTQMPSDIGLSAAPLCKEGLAKRLMLPLGLQD